MPLEKEVTALGGCIRAVGVRRRGRWRGAALATSSFFLEVFLKGALSSDYTRVDLEDAEAALCACA